MWPHWKYELSTCVENYSHAEIINSVVRYRTDRVYANQRLIRLECTERKFGKPHVSSGQRLYRRCTRRNGPTRIGEGADGVKIVKAVPLRNSMQNSVGGCIQICKSSMDRERLMSGTAHEFEFDQSTSFLRSTSPASLGLKLRSDPPAEYRLSRG